MKQIFISHSESDSDLARNIANGLEQSGYPTWYYERDSVPGPAYLIQVKREIEKAQAFLLIISHSSIKSPQVTSEVVRAYENGKPFIPVLRDLTHAEFQNLQPMWHQCLGAATSLGIVPNPKGIAESIKKILKGLDALGIKAVKEGGSDTGIPPDVGDETRHNYPPPKHSSWKRVIFLSIAVCSIAICSIALLLIVPGSITHLYGSKVRPESTTAQNEFGEEKPDILAIDGLVDLKKGYLKFGKKAYPREVKTEKAGIRMVLITPGEFMMGSPDKEAARCDEEGPQHKVRFTRPFYLGKYEVMQDQYSLIMGENPSQFKASNRPVEKVPWDDAVEFCRKMGGGCRLPTEAEWEYACRAGTTTPFYFGKKIWPDQAQYCGKDIYGSGCKCEDEAETLPVGSFAPNNWGLYDMHGNVWEWCADFWHKDYAGSPTDGSAWLKGGDQERRVARGGSCFCEPGCLRSALRGEMFPYRNYPENPNEGIGFRIAWTP